MKKSSTFGFTLAEVLITLGIIGVVAAITIPNLMENVRNRDLQVQLKKHILNGTKLVCRLWKNMNNLSQIMQPNMVLMQ